MKIVKETKKEDAQEAPGLVSRDFVVDTDKIKNLMPYMIEDNWLLNYGNLKGIERVLQGMNRRTKNKSQMHLAIKDLKLYYDDLGSDFQLFFDELIQFTNDKLKTL